MIVTPAKTILQQRRDQENIILLPREIEQCKTYFAQNNNRRICAFCSNPRAKTMNTNLNLARDMNTIMSLLDPFEYHISPFTTRHIFETVLVRHKPDIILYFGHALDNVLYLEKDDGQPEHFDVDEMIMALKPIKTHIKCIALFACRTETIALRLSTFLPDTYILFWYTETLEKGAQVFANAFLEYIAKFEGTIPFENAYWHGYTAFSQHFSIGDPRKKYMQWMAEINEAKLLRRPIDRSKKPADGIPGLVFNSEHIKYNDVTERRSRRDKVKKELSFTESISRSELMVYLLQRL